MKDLIYVVEDDEGMQEVYEGAFEENYRTQIFSNGFDFFAAFDEKNPTLSFSTLCCPRWTDSRF